MTAFPLGPTENRVCNSVKEHGNDQQLVSLSLIERSCIDCAANEEKIQNCLYQNVTPLPYAKDSPKVNDINDDQENRYLSDVAYQLVLYGPAGIFHLSAPSASGTLLPCGSISRSL